MFLFSDCKLSSAFFRVFRGYVFLEPETYAESHTATGEIILAGAVDNVNPVRAAGERLQKVWRRHIADWYGFIDHIENIIDADIEIERLLRRLFIRFVLA